MLDYILIGLCLVLVGIVGLQFTYMFYLDRIDRERKKHVRHLERSVKRLTEQLGSTGRRLADQNETPERVYPEYFFEDEQWADVIDER